MTIHAEVADAIRAGAAMRDQGGRITQNPYPEGRDDRTTVLRYYWSQGYQAQSAAAGVVSYDG